MHAGIDALIVLGCKLHADGSKSLVVLSIVPVIVAKVVFGCPLWIFPVAKPVVLLLKGLKASLVRT